MKKYFNLIIYLSISFLLYFLYKQSFLNFQNLSIFFPWIIISVLFLLFGFLWRTLIWYKILLLHDTEVCLSSAVASHGLSIFAKYIPGKVWTIIGRSIYISEKGFPLAKTSLISLKEQVITIWIGLAFGLIPIVIYKGFTKLSILLLLFFVTITVFILNKKINKLFLNLIARITRKDIELPYIKLKKLSKLSIYFATYWLILMIAYFFFVKSLHLDTSFIVAFVFPLATTLGILAIIFPGGIGVREGIMTGYLTLMGIPIKTAVTISVLSRLWFIIGEIFIFCVAFVVDKGKVFKKNLPKVLKG